MRFSILLAAIIGLLAAAANAQPSAFGPGERVTLSVHFMGMNAAQMSVKVGQGELAGTKVWPLEMNAHTQGLASTVFDIQEHFVSQFDPAIGRSIGWDRTNTNNGVVTSEHVRYDGATANIERTVDGERRDRTREIAAGSQDIIAAVYALRRAKLTPGATISLPVFEGRKSFTLEATVLAQENVDAAGGSIPAWKVSVRTRFEEKFAAAEPMTVWFSTGASHIPLRIEAPFLVGTMRAQLVDYVGATAP